MGLTCSKHIHVYNKYTGKCKGRWCKKCKHTLLDYNGDCYGCGKHVKHIADSFGNCKKIGCDAHICIPNGQGVCRGCNSPCHKIKKRL